MGSPIVVVEAAWMAVSIAAGLYIMGYHQSAVHYEG